ncbi:MAG: glycosyltransferase family 39 protein [Verrucomicrobiota bacterium]
MRNWLNLGLLSLLLAAWIFPGTIGRDPWKPDETYSFGMVLSIVESGDVVVPTLAGEPFMEKPPLLYALAALTAKVFSPLLALHEGARLALLFFHAITLVALLVAARELYGPGKAWLAALLLIGNGATLHNFHMLITDMALLSGFALGFCGLALSQRRPWLGGIVAGTGVGVALMAKGLIGPGLIGASTLLLPVLFRTWRTRNYLRLLAGMALAALPWVILWPTLLYARSPELFHQWFWVNNFGRFLGVKSGTGHLGPPNESFFYLRNLPNFTLPALPFALWTWWRGRREIWQRVDLQLTLLPLVVILGVLSMASDARLLYAQPIVLLLALAGAKAFDFIPETWIRRAHLLLTVFFGVVFVALWGGWLAELWQVPAPLWANVYAGFNAYQPAFHAIPFALALFATLLLAWRFWQTDRTDTLALVLNYTAGAIGAYLLLMTLFLPMQNARNSYRGLFSPLREILPAGSLVASRGIDDTERAMLHYYAGIKTRRVEVKKNDIGNCAFFFLQVNYASRLDPALLPAGPWKLIWEQQRLNRTVFRVYKKAGP